MFGLPLARAATRRLPGPLRCRLPQRSRASYATATGNIESFRKTLKEQAKLDKRSRNDDPSSSRSSFNDNYGLSHQTIDQWDLTVGIEIHAQLNTDHKLFSNAKSESEEDANTLADVFDLSVPGSQPRLQSEVLVPALRAALAFDCDVQQQSNFDRKHYFYHDQPAGYQITQYYKPFALGGQLSLYAHDGIAAEDGESITVGIKQIQLEQDTAKTVLQPPDTVLLDFNRVGHPLIEIISLPQIHHPKTAAAYVRKISQILVSTNAVTTGLELGGLRADVNVSVRRRGSAPGAHAYSGISGLGQRTEIKNLSSFKAIEDAITVERNRQIAHLESGGQIEGETRGYTLGGMETTKLRGKEGEVDYRYMPDPDIPTMVISRSLLDQLSSSLPLLPDEQLRDLGQQYGINLLDAKALISEGSRVQYFQEVLGLVVEQTKLTEDMAAKMAANWVLHELGGHFSTAREEFDALRVNSTQLASVLVELQSRRITGKTAKSLLSMLFDGETRPVTQIISEDNLALQQLSSEQYRQAAASLIEEHASIAKQARTGAKGKLQFLVGQMMRTSRGTMDAEEARRAIESVLKSSNGAS